MRIETLLKRFNPGRPMWWNTTFILFVVAVGTFTAITSDPFMVLLVSVVASFATTRLEPRLWKKFMAWWHNGMPTE